MSTEQDDPERVELRPGLWVHTRRPGATQHQTRLAALDAASRAVQLLPEQRDPDQVARRTISVAAIFENYLTNGRLDERPVDCGSDDTVERVARALAAFDARISIRNSDRLVARAVLSELRKGEK